MRLVKASLFIIWFLLLGLLLHRDFFVRTLDTREVMALERDRRVEYQSIYFKDDKIGYVENQFLPQDDQTLRIKQQARMQLMISGQNHPVELDLDALLGSQSDLISFEFSFTSPFYRMRADGTVNGETVTFELDTGNNVVRDQVVLDGPPRLRKAVQPLFRAERTVAQQRRFIQTTVIQVLFVKVVNSLGIVAHRMLAL